jgi:drug/metabolite transporter (DMT)-like permease
MRQNCAMAAILFAFASAALLGGGAVIAQFGLRTVHPLSGAAISIPAFTLCFILISPFLLRGVAVDWRAVPIFAAIGLTFPAFVTLLTFASGRALGPVVTSSLGNLAPLFSVALAVVVLHEPLRPLQMLGLAISVAGALTITVTRTPQVRDWRTWALLLPLAAALLRGVIPPVIKLGLEIWPYPIAAGLIGYITSTLTVLAIERVRTGRFMTQAPISGRLWFAATGICNGVGTLLLYAAVGSGPVTLVAPVIATYPLFTVGLSAILLTHLKLTVRLVLGTVLAVAGVMLVIVG